MGTPWRDGLQYVDTVIGAAGRAGMGPRGAAGMDPRTVPLRADPASPSASPAASCRAGPAVPPAREAARAAARVGPDQRGEIV